MILGKEEAVASLLTDIRIRHGCRPFRRRRDRNAHNSFALHAKYTGVRACCEKREGTRFLRRDRISARDARAFRAKWGRDADFDRNFLMSFGFAEGGQRRLAHSSDLSPGHPNGVSVFRAVFPPDPRFSGLASFEPECESIGGRFRARFVLSGAPNDRTIRSRPREEVSHDR